MRDIIETKVEGEKVIANNLIKSEPPWIRNENGPARDKKNESNRKDSYNGGTLGFVAG
jgi:hypothetical protein